MYIRVSPIRSYVARTCTSTAPRRSGCCRSARSRRCSHGSGPWGSRRPFWRARQTARQQHSVRLQGSLGSKSLLEGPAYGHMVLKHTHHLILLKYTASVRKHTKQSRHLHQAKFAGITTLKAQGAQRAHQLEALPALAGVAAGRVDADLVAVGGALRALVHVLALHAVAAPACTGLQLRLGLGSTIHPTHLERRLVFCLSCGFQHLICTVQVVNTYRAAMQPHALRVAGACGA